MFNPFSVKPKAPQIFALTAENMSRLNDNTSGLSFNVDLECVSRGGNPAPTLLWFRRSMTSSPEQSSASVVHEDDGTYTATSRLSVNVTENDTFVCQSSLESFPRLTQSTEYHVLVGM